MGNLTIEDLLDGLPDPVALLKTDGTIAFVNRAWRAATESCAFISSTSSQPLQPGEDYLAMCRGDAGGDSDGPFVAAGIESVLSGAEPLFEFVYSDTARPRPRSFRMRVTPVGDVPQERRALLSHADVTHDTLLREEHLHRAPIRDIPAQRQGEEELRLRASLLADAQGLAHIGTWSLDVATQRLTWSPETLEVFGLDDGSFDERFETFVNTVLPEDRAELEAQIALAAESETGAFAVDYRMRRPDGEIRWLYDRGRVQRDDQGNIVRRLGVVMDVTERRDMELALRVSEERFRKIFTNAATGIAICSLEGTIQEINQAYGNMLGYEPKALVGRPIGEVTHPDDREMDRQLLRELVDGVSESFVREKRYIQSSGEIVWGRIYVSLFENKAAGSRHFIAVTQDITEGKRTLKALERSETMLAVASRIGRLGGWTVTFPDETLTWTREMHDLIEGEPPSGLDGVVELCVPEHRAVLRRAVERCLEHGTPFDVELEVESAMGRRFWARCIGEAVRDAAGQLRLMQGTLQDITERKEAEKSLLRSEQRFRILADAMPIIVWTATAEGVIDYANQLFHDVTGAREDVRPEEAWLEAVHPDDLVDSVEAWQVAVQNHKPFEADARIRVRSGAGEEEYHWHHASAVPINDDTGTAAKWYGTAIDIHATRAAQKTATRLSAALVATLESIADVFFSLDARFHFEFANPEAGRITGCAPADLAGLHVRSALAAPLAEAVMEGARVAQRSGAAAEIEVQDETGRWFAGRAWPTPAGGVSVYLRDETQARQAQEALRASEERFKTLSRATTDAIWDWDLATDAVWRNEGFEKLFGALRRAGDASYWMAGIHPEDRDRVVGTLRRVLDEGQELWVEEYRFQRADGTYAYVLDRGHVIRDENGAAVRMIGGMTDLTERREVDERLAEQAELIEKATDAIVVRGLDGTVRYLNREAEVLFGWPREEAVGVNVTTLQFARSRPTFADANEAVLRRGEWRGELEQIRRDGSSVLVESRWTLLRRPDGEPYGVLAINTDISERKRLEQQVLRAQRLESVGTLAGGIAHDLNNLLTPILFSIELLRDGEQDPRRLADLDLVETCARRGSDMISRLLSFARGYEGRRTTVLVPALFEEVEKLLKDTLPKAIEGRSSVPDQLWPVKGDPTQLHQVLVNLCVNARDAMPQGGELTLTAENLVLDESNAGMLAGAKLGEYVLVRVIDTGEGMSAEVLERLFEPFFTTKAVGKGSGLGLSTTHAIVKSHGGYLDVESQLGKGTEFRIYLPAAPGPIASRVAAGEFDVDHGAGECILVVDDEEAIRNIAKRTLTRYGYRVLLASNGAEGLATYVRHRDAIDLVVTDMSMPIMDGAALIIALRNINPDVRIVASSGLDMNGELASSVGANVSHFVNKPYTAQTMLRVLREALEENG